MDYQQVFINISGIWWGGSDGLPTGFYQYFWNMVGNDLISKVRQTYNSCYLLKELNHTLITLIPKSSCPNTFKEFRLISVCNVAYKIISKLPVLRLQSHMKDLISPNQYAFIKGRLISDSIFLIAEMMNFIHKAKQKKSFWCAIKIDFFQSI